MTRRRPAASPRSSARPVSSSAHDLAVEDRARRPHGALGAQPRPWRIARSASFSLRRRRGSPRRPSTYATARYPSHLTSCSHRLPVGRPPSRASRASARSAVRRGGQDFVARATCSSGLAFLQQQPVLRVAVSFAGTSVHRPSSRCPWRRTVSPPSRFSSTSSYVPWSQISTDARAVLAGRDLALERRVGRAGGPRRARRAAARPARAGRPSARPSSQVRRSARGGSRSGAALRRGAGRRRSVRRRARSRPARTAPASTSDPVCGGTPRAARA